jgi:hypothetical protein
MKCSFKYIFSLFLVVYFLLKLITKEKYINFSEYHTIVSNPNKAGSINELYVKDFKENVFSDTDYEDNILDQNTFTNPFLKKEKIMYQKMKEPVPIDYARYEVILPKEFQVPQIKYIDQRPIIGISYPPDFRKEDSILAQGGSITGTDEGLPDFITRDQSLDCQGKWGEWNDDYCLNDKKRCSLKYRIYKVTKKKKDGGRSCRYNNDIVRDKDIEYDYCFGNSNTDRCGTNENMCPCKMDGLDSTENDCDNTTADCKCADEEEVNNEGKCPGASSDNNIPDITEEEFYGLSLSAKASMIARGYPDPRLKADENLKEVSWFLRLINYLVQWNRDRQDAEREAAVIREQERIRREPQPSPSSSVEGATKSGEELLTSIKEKLRLLVGKRHRLNITPGGDDNSFNENKIKITEKNDIRKGLFQEFYKYISNEFLIKKHSIISRFATIKGQIIKKEDEFDIYLSGDNCISGLDGVSSCRGEEYFKKFAKIKEELTVLYNELETIIETTYWYNIPLVLFIIIVFFSLYQWGGWHPGHIINDMVYFLVFGLISLYFVYYYKLYDKLYNYFFPDKNEIEEDAMEEAINSPLIGADGADRSDPEPRDQSGAGRRDDVRPP